MPARSSAAAAPVVHKNIVFARHAAALAAWPGLPVNLPLSMALEEDEDDDKKTKQGKAAALKAVAKVDREWRTAAGT